MKYPIYNPLAHICIRVLDFLLAIVYPRKKLEGYAQPKKILISNIGHLGDVILATSLLPVLKKAYPQAQIGMLVGSVSKGIVINHPLINFYHTFDHWKNNRSSLSFLKKISHHFKTKKDAVSSIRKVNYDLAIDCNFHFPNAAPLLWKVKIPQRVGFVTAGFSPLLTKAFPWDCRSNLSAVDAFLSLMPNLKQFYPFATPTLNASNEKCKKGYLVFHIGAGAAHKLWPLEHWKELTHRLIKENYEILFTGKGQEEWQMINTVIDGQTSAHNLVDQLNWSAFVEIIKNANLLVGVDSSAGHVAAAVKTPSVLLYPGIHPPLLWKPYSQLTKVLTYPTACSPCFVGCKTMRCLHMITVEQVYLEIKKKVAEEIPENEDILEDSHSLL